MTEPDTAAALRQSRTAAILGVVRSIPRGSVLGYGDVARRAGLPRHARLVAKVLAANSDPDLPWHRVLRSDGHIALPAGSAAAREQARRLRAEGVELVAGRVRRIQAAADLDSALWSPSG